MTRDHLADGEAMIDWTGGPVLTDPRHQIVLKAITECLQIGNPDLQIMNDGPDRDQTVFEAPWRDIQDAVGNYKAALWLAKLPAEPRLDWRQGLRALKKTAGSSGRIPRTQVLSHRAGKRARLGWRHAG